ncbi:DUF1579 family protein [Nitratireductor mangrovi]|uniref:DUF1579 family protein n=1 Tax=Nitratireductor mangrovi TaxID=2599600 RepID=A0A6H0DY12_9HYPH|nr:DUF1579 family protein [Nitratireductor mangrovi]QIS94688.1 DUF1579 family protein [Nitratireductor mangrovi]
MNLAIALLALAAFAAAPAQAASLVDGLVGEWRGKGLTRERPGAPLERAACRMTARAAGAARIEVTGRCGTAGGTARFAITLEKRSGGRVDAHASSPVLPGDVAYSGTASGNRIDFRAVAPLEIDGEAWSSRVVFAFNGADAFAMVETATRAADGERQTFFDMRYRREAKPQ